MRKKGKESVFPDFIRMAGVLMIAIGYAAIGLVSHIKGWEIPLIIGLIIYAFGETLD